MRRADLMWLVFIQCDHSPILLATLSGEPTAMKNDLLMASKSKPPCILSASAALLELVDRRIAEQKLRRGACVVLEEALQVHDVALALRLLRVSAT